LILETKRLILRPWKVEDAKELYKYARDPRVGSAAGWPAHTSIQYSLQIIEEVLKASETYAIVLKQTMLPIGNIKISTQGFGNVAMSDTEAEIGYWLGVSYWGQGLMPKAVFEILRRCFEDLYCTGVWCGYYDGNTRSRRVQEKCGFVYHHSIANHLTPYGEIRTEHFTYLSREKWIYMVKYQ
jgi:ribosomal-protein-alanine N-acetyltransferase